jgi:uncharacterized protein YbjT (DUF2867 family)
MDGMGRFIVVGQGRLGTAVAQALSRDGNEVAVVSKSSGVDVTRPVSLVSYRDFDAIVEATDTPNRSRRKSIAFFSASTKNIKAAAIEAGIGRHVLISIVNCEYAALAKDGYYAGKAVQEKAAMAVSGLPTSIVRSTMWYEFAAENLARMSVGPVTVVPRIRSRPVALTAVAAIVALRCVDDGPPREDLCGPDELTLWEMTMTLPHRPRLPLSVPIGAAFSDGTLIPKNGRVVGPRFGEWLGAAPQS